MRIYNIYQIYRCDLPPPGDLLAWLPGLCPGWIITPRPPASIPSTPLKGGDPTPMPTPTEPPVLKSLWKPALNEAAVASDVGMAAAREEAKAAVLYGEWKACMLAANPTPPAEDEWVKGPPTGCSVKIRVAVSIGSFECRDCLAPICLDNLPLLDEGVSV